jgi:hypothetical protein
MTKREKRLQDLRRKIARRERDRELGIKLLVKAATELPVLRKQEARLSAGWHLKPKPVPKPADDLQSFAEKMVAAAEAVINNDDGLDIPDYLRRQQERSVQAEADVQARAEIMAQQAAEKKRKADITKQKRAIKEEVRHAELTGQRRKMPLSGKEALAAVRGQ